MRFLPRSSAPPHAQAWLRDHSCLRISVTVTDAHTRGGFRGTEHTQPDLQPDPFAVECGSLLTATVKLFQCIWGHRK